MIGWLRRRRTPLAAARWLAVDCETSGLDPAADRLLAVGALAVQGGRVELASAWHAVLAQAEPSAAANILVHGIGGDAQRSGRPWPAARAELEQLLHGAIPVAFHAAFDAAVLLRHGVKARWLDLAQLAPALYPARARDCRALDDWLAAFGIEQASRHDALGDAFAAAQLLLVLLGEARRQGLASAEDVVGAAGDRRWLAPG